MLNSRPVRCPGRRGEVCVDLVEAEGDEPLEEPRVVGRMGVQPHPVAQDVVEVLTNCHDAAKLMTVTNNETQHDYIDF